MVSQVNGGVSSGRPLADGCELALLLADALAAAVLLPDALGVPDAPVASSPEPPSLPQADTRAEANNQDVFATIAANYEEVRQ